MNKQKKKILLIAMPNSIHTARWLNQINNRAEWEIHLFPSIEGEITHPLISGVVVHYLFRSKHIRFKQTTKITQLDKVINSVRVHIIDKFFPQYRAKKLVQLITKLKPDLIHSMEIQAAGYLALEAMHLLKAPFPRWWVTNWGSDIYLFGRLHNHKQKIIDVLAGCDFYSCECDRDVTLAKSFGFNKTVLPIFPNTGGFDLPRLRKQRDEISTSDRKFIMLKGYQNWAGRALVGLRALERCTDLLYGYTVVIYSASAEVKVAAELFTEKTGVAIYLISHGLPHSEILTLHSKARISIGISISDAISTSLLEAIVMGSFPIQSCTACADEWIEEGVNGFIVPPEDPDVIEIAIRKALTDDDLVNKAAKINWAIANSRLDADFLAQKTVDSYQHIFNLCGAKTAHLDIGGLK
jgi:glycosyltransferase involved in cell wall biosynthesis